MHLEQCNPELTEPIVDIDYPFVKEDKETLRVSYRRLKDGSAYIFGDKEYGFEGSDDSWKKAWQFLLQQGFIPSK